MPRIRVPLADLFYTRKERAELKEAAKVYGNGLQPVAVWKQQQAGLKSPLPDLASANLAALASAIADTGASGNFWGKGSEGCVANVDPAAPPISVGTATGESARSVATADHRIPNLPEDFPRSGHVMPNFPHSLVGIGPICDAGYTVEFTSAAVVVRATCGRAVLTGWRDQQPPKLWRFALRPDAADALPEPSSPRQTASLAAFSAYDLPSVEALVRYFHAAAGYPVKDTWLRAIKAGNYASWPGLTYHNAAKYCPTPDATLKGHMVQGRQGVRSTKPKQAKATAPAPEPEPAPDGATWSPSSPRSNLLIVNVRHISRLYTDDTGRFPIRSRSGNQYIMVAYHCDSGSILAACFKSRQDIHRLAAYNSIMARIKQRGFDVDLQILDNEASQAYKDLITNKWGAKFQLVPPHMHRRNAAERAIRTFKAHFLAILAGVSADFPRYLWDLLVPQAEMTLNFLRQSPLNPKISAWEYFNGPFNYDATPLGPLGSRLLAHRKPGVRNSWDFRAEDGWGIGVSLDHYRCQRYVARDTHEEKVTDTCSFRHPSMERPQPTAADRLQHGMLKLADALTDAPPRAPDAQLEALEKLQAAFQRWITPAAEVPPPSGPPASSVAPARAPRRSPRLNPPPRAPPTSSPRVQPAEEPARPPRVPNPPEPAPPPRVVVPPPPAQPPRVATAPRPVPPPPPAQPGPSPPPVAEEDEPVARRTRAQKRPADEPVARRTRAQTRPTVVPDPEPVARRTRSRAKKASLKATLAGAFAVLSAAMTGTSTAAALRPPPRAAREPPLRVAPRTPLPAPRPARPPPALTPSSAARRQFPAAFLFEQLANPVIDEETGESLEYRQLKRHPKLAEIWLRAYSNEMGRLCQGIGKGDQGPKQQRIKGTDTFRVIHYHEIPRERRKEIAHVRVVSEVRPQKADPNRVRITVAGGNIECEFDIGTPTASLELVKLQLNSVLSRKGAKFAAFDAANYYLETPEMAKKEYVRIRYTDIPEEFRKEYNLDEYVHNGWVYFEVVRPAYGLPQSGRIANDVLRERLNKEGYFEAPTTPGLWRHKWRPITFVLIVDDFGVEYVGKEHADHLLGVLNRYYKMSEDWEGKKFAGIDIEWNYGPRHCDRWCRLSMKNYISDLLLKEGWKKPATPQLSPHKHREIIYGAKQQLSAEADDSPPLNVKGIRRIQRIVGALLYYARAVDNKLLCALSAIGSRQAAATEKTNVAVAQLLDYVATYPDDGIIYRPSDMVLCAHSDAGFHNETRGRSRNGAHIFLSEDDPSPKWNGPLLTLAGIMKTVLASASEAELGALYETARTMVPLRQALIEMGWPQPKSPLQTDNSTADGVVNNTIVPKRLKSMDLRLHWLRCREAQGQFRFYWDKGTANWADYPTKHHPPCYHEGQRLLHAGIKRTRMVRGG